MIPTPKIFRAVFVVALILIAIMLALYLFSAKNNSQEDSLKATNYKRTELSGEAPSGIPVLFTPADNSKITQSYVLDYATKEKQSSVVFEIEKTLSQSLLFYKDLLQKEGWTMANAYDGPQVKSLYGLKQNQEINITMTPKSGTPKVSNISVSILSK